MKPAAFYLENASQVSSTNTQLGLGDEDSYYSDDWLTFHNLVTHDGSTGKAAPELMMQSLVAIFLLRCLKYKKYYDSDQDQESNDLKGQLTPTELTLASILHHNMRAAFYNTHEVARIETDGRSMKRVGRATNPTLALINHSCDPNYRRISIGTTTLAYATKLIPKGGEILDNYAQTFDASPKEARLKYLEKYNFQCQCQACRENWPTLEGLSRKLTSLDKQDGYLPPFQGDASRIKAAIKAVEKAEKHIEKLRSCQTPQDEQQQKTRLVELLEIQRSHMLDLRSLIKAPHFKICLAESNLYHTLLLICKQRMT